VSETGLRPGFAILAEATSHEVAFLLFRPTFPSLTGDIAMTDELSEDAQNAIEAATFRRLLQHLDAHKEVQNIDLMNLAAFCRNCLAKWYRAAADERGLSLTDGEARERVYGMPYPEWKARYQLEQPAVSSWAADAGTPAVSPWAADAGTPAVSPSAADAGTPAVSPSATDAGTPAVSPSAADAGTPAVSPSAADAGPP